MPLMLRRLVSWSWLLVPGAAAGCGGEPVAYVPPEPPTAIHVEVTNGDLQTDTVTHELPEPILVRVTDQDGRALGGRTVYFEVTAGGGIVFVGAYPTSGAGAAFERWTLGPLAGEQELAVRLTSPEGDLRTYARVTATALPDQPIGFTHTVDAPDSLRLFLAETATLPARADVVAHDAYDNAIELSVPLAWTAPATAVLSGTEVAAAAEGREWLTAVGDTTGIFGTLRDSISLRTLADVLAGRPHWTWEQVCTGHPDMQRDGVAVGADSATWTVVSAEGRHLDSGDLIFAETGYGAWDDLWIAVRSGTFTVYWRDGVVRAADSLWVDDGSGERAWTPIDSVLMGRNVARTAVDAARLGFVQLARETLVAAAGTAAPLTLHLVGETPWRYEGESPLPLGRAACAVSLDGSNLLAAADSGRTTLVAR